MAIIKVFSAFLIALFTLHFSVGIEFIEHITDQKLLIYVFEEYEQYGALPMSFKIGGVLSALVFVLMLTIKNKVKDQYGFSKYADLKDRKEAKLDSEDGIVLGEMVIPNINDKRNHLKYKKTSKTLRMNKPLSIGILTPPDAGKTSCVIIPTLLSCRNSIIVHDPKGEVFEATADSREQFSKIIRFDPMQVNGKGCVFNPFSQNLIPEDERKIFGYVSQIANILISDSGREDKDFFTRNAKIIFAFVACYLIKVNGGTSLSEIGSKIFENKDIVETFEEMIEEVEGLEEQSNFTESIIKQGNMALTSAESEKTWVSIIATLAPALEMYTTNEMIKEATDGENDIDIMRFKEETHTLYLIVPDEDRKTLAPLIRLLFETLAGKLLSVSEYNKTGVGNKLVTFLIDEFPRLGKMEEILELPAISRGMEVNVVLVAQSITQIEEVYGRQRARGLFDLLSYWYIFKQNSDETAEMFSKLIGKQTVTRISHSYNTKGIIDLNSSKSQSEEGLPLVSADEIKSMHPDYGLLVTSHNTTRPFKVKHEKYYENKVYCKMIEGIKM
ncbi:MAG: type IV secretory system conjugative DNA transfer family protein [Proteobacteria bacterium]|nr:type IV secretory system conjugative DNA transfer family protein [Pseudomonadota bacterium]